MKMGMPGFTAEASLYRSIYHYRGGISNDRSKARNNGVGTLPETIPRDLVVTAWFWNCPKIRSITWGWDGQSICTCDNPHLCRFCTTHYGCFVDSTQTCCDGYTCMCDVGWIYPGMCRNLEDGDIIQVVIEHNAVDPAIVKFVLESGWRKARSRYFDYQRWVNWWKGLNVPDGEGNSWDIWMQDNKRRDSVSLWAHQVHNGQCLTFSKAKFLGRHCPVYRLCGIDRLQPGDRVTFRWVQD